MSKKRRQFISLCTGLEIQFATEFTEFVTHSWDKDSSFQLWMISATTSRECRLPSKMQEMCLCRPVNHSEINLLSSTSLIPTNKVTAIFLLFIFTKCLLQEKRLCIRHSIWWNGRTSLSLDISGLQPRNKTISWLESNNFRQWKWIFLKTTTLLDQLTLNWMMWLRCSSWL